MDEQKLNEMAFQLLEKQVGLREMQPAEMAEMLGSIKASLKKVFSGEAVADEGVSGTSGELASSEISEEDRQRARKSITKNHIECMECGKKMGIITIRHLKTHGFNTAQEYLEKWGLPRDTKLISKGLQKTRQEKMQGMKLWERTPFYAKKLEAEKAQQDKAQAEQDKAKAEQGKAADKAKNAVPKDKPDTPKDKQ